MPEQFIRFAVTNLPSNERSSTWKCLANKNDIYLMCREMGGSLKISFHESGSWRIAYLKEFFEKSVPGVKKNRVIKEWMRPSAISPDVTMVCRLIIPAAAVSRQILSIKNQMHCVPRAKEGKAIEISILITGQGAHISDWSGNRVMNTTLIGSMLLDNRETVWLVYREIEPPKIMSGAGNPLFYKGKTETDLYREGLRAITFGEDAKGLILFDNGYITRAARNF